MKIKRALKTSFILFVFSIAVLVFSILSTSFAEFYAKTISSVFRLILSAFTGFFEFSLAELFVIALPLLIIFYVVFTLVTFFVNRSLCKMVSKILLIILLCAIFVFVNTFGVCYFRRPFDVNMDLTRKRLSRHEMYLSTQFIKTNLEKSCKDVKYDNSGSSVNPHSWSELDDLIDDGFDRLCDRYDFISNIYSKPKKILLSPLMTYTHISGVYFPFTGEANVNINYPDYVVAFTVAHEKAHQRGIAGEDEANFIAFLALINSGDKYLTYSALMNMYDYYLDSIYSVDKEMYFYLLDSTDKQVLGEMYSYSEFFDKYRASSASKVADKMNDTYIKAMGDGDGTESYGKVVELVSAYFYKNNGLH